MIQSSSGSWLRLAARLTIAMVLAGSGALVSHPAPAQDEDRAVTLQNLPAEQAQLARNKYALVIGIDDYQEQDIADLQFCAADATAVAEALQTACGYPASNVTLLLDGEATRVNLLKALGRLSDRTLYPDPDTLVVYYSGHGVNVEGSDYLIPCDGSIDPDIAADTSIALDRLMERLQASGFPRIMLFIDACRSALYTGARAGGGFNQEWAARSSAGIKVMFSAEAGRMSKETADLGHGVFTYYLLEGLSGAAADQEGLITFGDMEKFILGKMRDYSMQNVGREQLPVTKGEGSAGMLIAVVSPPKNENSYLAEQLRFRGNEFYEQQKYQEAVSQYRAALTLDPEDTSTYFNLGFALGQLGDYWGAIAVYTLYVEIDPNNSMVHNNLGVSYMHLQLYDNAQSSFLEALRLDPQNPYPQRNLGDLMLEQGRRDEALQAYTAAVQIDPKWSMPYYSIGKLYAQEADYDNAQLWYTQAMAVDPSFYPPLLELGQIALLQLNYADAEEHFLNAIQLAPQAYECYNALGSLYMLQGRYADAAVRFNQAAELAPLWYFQFGGLGDAYYQLERYEEAIAAYRQAIQLDPSWAWLHQGLANALLDSGQLEASLPEFQMAFQLNPQLSRAHCGLGLALCRLGRHGESEAELLLAMQLDVMDPLPLLGLAELYYAMEKYPLARETAQQALKLAAAGSSDLAAAEEWLRQIDTAESR